MWPIKEKENTNSHSCSGQIPFPASCIRMFHYGSLFNINPSGMNELWERMAGYVGRSPTKEIIGDGVGYNHLSR